MMRRLAAALLLVLVGGAPAHAAYNDNIVGRLADVMTYDNGNILFRLDPMPQNPQPGTGGCYPIGNGRYFVIPNSVPADARAQMLSRLLTAKATNEAINIGFDNTTCSGGYILTHRVG